MTNLPSLVTSPLPHRTSPVRSANIRLLEMKMARKRMAAPKWTRSLDRCANSAGQRIVIERREGGKEEASPEILQDASEVRKHSS